MQLHVLFVERLDERLVFGRDLRELGGQDALLVDEPLPPVLPFLLAGRAFDELLGLLEGIFFLFLRGLLQLVVEHGHLLLQAVGALPRPVLQFLPAGQQGSPGRFRFLPAGRPLGQAGFRLAIGGGQFAASLHQGGLLAAHLRREGGDFLGLFLGFAFLELFHIVQAGLEVLQVLLVAVQVDARLVFVDRRDDGLLDELCIELRVEQHVLDGARNVLILLALHQREALQFGGHAVAVENVPVFVERVDDARVADAPFVEHAPDAVGAGIGGAGLCVHEEVLAVGGVDKPVADTVHLLEAEDAESPPFGGHLVDDVGVGIREIILCIALFLHRDAQLLGIGVVEEQDGTEHGALAHALRTDEVDIAVEVDVVGIGDVGAVDEDDSIQFSHKVPLFLRKC